MDFFRVKNCNTICDCFIIRFIIKKVSVCDCSRRNETKDMVELRQILYELYPMLDAEAHNRSI